MTKNDATYRNPFDLDELTYNGPIYHYTSEEKYQKIMQPAIGFVPEDCISLRLRNIAHMTDKNDKKERKHIYDTVYEAAKRLLSQKQISKDFYDIVIHFESLEKGYSISDTGITNRHIHVQNSKWRLTYTQLDYYVSCFSVNPDNKRIKDDFNAPMRIPFNKFFSASQPHYIGRLTDDVSICAPQYYGSLYPFCSFSGCKLEYYIKRVVYDDEEKINLIASCLTYIGNHYLPTDKDDIAFHLQAMYTLYDAFFKNISLAYEEEVRLVVRLARTAQTELLSKNYVILDGEDGMYLPISKDFLENE